MAGRGAHVQRQPRQLSHLLWQVPTNTMLRISPTNDGLIAVALKGRRTRIGLKPNANYVHATNPDDCRFERSAEAGARFAAAAIPRAARARERSDARQSAANLVLCP